MSRTIRVDAEVADMLRLVKHDLERTLKRNVSMSEATEEALARVERGGFTCLICGGEAFIGDDHLGVAYHDASGIDHEPKGSPCSHA